MFSVSGPITYINVFTWILGSSSDNFDTEQYLMNLRRQCGHVDGWSRLNFSCSWNVSTMVVESCQQVRGVRYSSTNDMWRDVVLTPLPPWFARQYNTTNTDLGINMCFLFRPPFYKFLDVVYLVTLKVEYTWNTWITRIINCWLHVDLQSWHCLLVVSRALNRSFTFGQSVHWCVVIRLFQINIVLHFGNSMTYFL